MRAPEVTSGAALLLRGGDPEREGDKQWGLMPGAWPPARAGGSPGRARPGRCCYCLGHGAFPGVSGLGGSGGLGAEALSLFSGEDPTC